MRWDEMSMQQKSGVMALMIRNGVYRPSDMKQRWDEFQERQEAEQQAEEEAGQKRGGCRCRLTADISFKATACMRNSMVCRQGMA